MSDQRSQPAPLADTRSEKRQPPFFRLPAELRNVIYEDVLSDLGSVFTCFGGLTYIQHHLQHRRVGLLFVNRQIYQETHLLPYSLNPITVGPRTKSKEWMQRRTREQLRAITRLHFVFNDFFLDAVDDSDGSLAVSPEGIEMITILDQQLTSPDLSGLKHILVELRSHEVHVHPLMVHIEFLQEAKMQIKRLSPQADVTVELICIADIHYQTEIPASSMAGIRIVRFDKLCEGEGHSAQDTRRWKALFQDSYANEDMRKDLRDTWQILAARRRGTFE